METLRNYFSNTNDYDDALTKFDELSKKLKIIHQENRIVPILNSDEIDVDDQLSFKTSNSYGNFELEKRNNIVSFAKLMIGTYLSINTQFRDLSNDDHWIMDNFEDIFATIHEKYFDKEYFEAVLFEGKNYYYCDYLDRKRQGERLKNQNQSVEGKNSIKQLTKTMRTAGSDLYEILEDEAEIKEKNANLQITFNPLLIGISLTIITILSIMLVLTN